MANEVVVEIVFDADTGQFRRVLRDTERQAKQSGEKIGRNLENGIDGVGVEAFKRLGAAAVAAAATIATAFAGREIIAASARQQEAVNSLNASLSRIGQFSQETSQDLQDFASSLQAVTRFGDEAILEQIAFAQGLGATAEQSKLVSEAATDLSAALNIDLNAATRNIARTLGGFAGELGEVIPELKNFTTEQLQAGAAIDLIADRFRGLAQAQTNTFAGSLEQLTNTFGDLLESLGNFITQSPTVIAIFQTLGNVIRVLDQRVQSLASNGDVLSPLTESFERFTNILLELAPAFEVVSRGIDLLINTARVGFNGFISQLSLVGDAAGRLIQVFAPDSEIAQALRDFNESTLSDFNDSIADTAESFNTLFDPLTAQERLQGFVETVRVAAQESSEALQNLGTQAKQTNEETAQSFDNTGKAIANTVRTAIVGSISRGIQQVAANLARGESLFENFGSFVLNTLGDLAIKVGELAIAFGITVGAIESLSPGVAIAAGAALIAIGSVVKALASSDSGGLGDLGAGPGTGGIATAATASPEGDSLTGTPTETADPDTRVTVNIQGDVLDSRDTGLRIVELINQSFDSDGTVITNGTFV